MEGEKYCEEGREFFPAEHLRGPHAKIDFCMLPLKRTTCENMIIFTNGPLRGPPMKIDFFFVCAPIIKSSVKMEVHFLDETVTVRYTVYNLQGPCTEKIFLW